MASVKSKPTVAIVNPKDPKDPVPWHANIEDVRKRGWTLWADRHDPALLADAEAAEDKKPEAPKKPAGDTKDDQKPDTKDDQKNKPADGPAVDPKSVKKAPPKKA